MKKLTLLLSLTFLIISCSDDDSTVNTSKPTGAWTLYNQEQVDAFGASGYTEILPNYNLFIEYKGGGSPITSLLPLSSLTKVGGDLFISNCEITNLEGLNNLESVAGIFSITHNSNLVNLNGLDNLTSISLNTSLSSFTGISMNPSLLTLDGLENLSYVKGNLSISGNSNLTNINGLSGLLHVGGNLVIGNGDALLDLCGISNLLQNNGLVGDYSSMNGYNPTIADILNGDCQLQ